MQIKMFKACYGYGIIINSSQSCKYSDSLRLLHVAQQTMRFKYIYTYIHHTLPTLK